MRKGQEDHFKMFSESDLKWPVDSFLVANEKMIKPTNGIVVKQHKNAGNRICIE